MVGLYHLRKQIEREPISPSKQCLLLAVAAREVLTLIGSRVEPPWPFLANSYASLTRIVSSEASAAPHRLSTMCYCHMSLDWYSEAIADAVGANCISHVGGNLCLCLLIQDGNCCCDRGC